MAEPTKDEALNFARSEAAGNASPEPPKESREDEFLKDEWRIKMESRRVSSYDELVKECKIDLDLWEVDRFKCKSYEVTFVPRSTRKSDIHGWIRPETKSVTVPMFSISASFKKRQEVQFARDVLAEVKQQFSSLFPKKISPPPPAPRLTGNVLEVNISDHHFAKLAWGKENGGRDWDL